MLEGRRGGGREGGVVVERKKIRKRKKRIIVFLFCVPVLSSVFKVSGHKRTAPGALNPNPNPES